MQMQIQDPKKSSGSISPKDWYIIVPVTSPVSPVVAAGYSWHFNLVFFAVLTVVEFVINIAVRTVVVGTS